MFYDYCLLKVTVLRSAILNEICLNSCQVQSETVWYSIEVRRLQWSTLAIIQRLSNYPDHADWPQIAKMCQIF